MRGDLEQMEPAARAIFGTAAVAPRHNPELHRSERREVFGPVHDVARERRHFFLHRGEAAGACRVGSCVELGLTRKRCGIRLWRLLRGLLRECDGRHARRRDGDDEWT
jgi:hypothetical protein